MTLPDKVYYAETAEEFASAIKDMPTLMLLEFRDNARANHALDLAKPANQIEIQTRETRDGMTLISPVDESEQVDAGERILRAIDAEIRGRTK